MNPYRAALLGGMLYCLPLAAWLLGGLEPAPDGRDLTEVAGVLPVVQGAALVLMLPALACGSRWSGLGAATLLLILPWPLLPLLQFAGVGLSVLLIEQALVIGLGLPLVLLWGFAADAVRGWVGTALGGGLQLGALLALIIATPLLPGLAQ